MKIKLLLLLIAPLLLMNCKEDDAADSYAGVWIGSSIEVANCTSEEDNFTNNLSCDENTCYRLTLNGDGTFSYQTGLDTISGTWSISGSTLSLFTDEEGEQVRTDYTTTLGENLTLSSTSESNGCTTTTTFGRE